MKNTTPIESEANWMCSILVLEVSNSCTWKDKIDAINAILDIRREEKNMVAEWKFLNQPSDMGSVPPENASSLIVKKV